MTKAEVIANAQAQNASEEEIAVLENAEDSQFDVGKETDVTTEDATVTSESTASESTDLPLEDTSDKIVVKDISRSKYMFSLFY